MEKIEQGNVKVQQGTEEISGTLEIKKITVNIGFIGAGNMAKAIGEGLLNSNIIKPNQIYISAPSQNNLQYWKSLGANTTTSNSVVAENCPIVVLAVKPQFASEAILSAFSNFNNIPVINSTVVSILAGVTIDDLKYMIQKTNLKSPGFCDKFNIIRAMPNTPILVGEGCTVYCCEQALTGDSKLAFEEHKAIVHSIFSVNGFCDEVSERLISPIGALSGSGPAYVYNIIEALSDGAVKLGVPRSLSYTLAAKTLIGGAKMVLETGKHPGELKDAVCSPGGTTIAGISVMEKNGIRYGLIEAIEATYKRSEELFKKN